MHATLTTRFAPSPTGALHLGHALAALIAHDTARKSDGRFLVRIEDIDQARCRPEFIEGIEEDLRWLGLVWETPGRRQSAHFDDYRASLERLRAMELVYPCFCTRSDIAREISGAGEAGEIVQVGRHVDSGGFVYMVEFSLNQVVGCMEPELAPRQSSAEAQ